MKNFFIFFLILFTSFIVNAENQNSQIIISGLIANNYLTANPIKKFHPINLIDNNESTFWLENYSNKGTEAECSIFFDSSFNLDEIEILGGCFTEEFPNYHRLKTVNIIIDENSNFRFNLNDVKKGQRLKLPQILVKKSLKFKISAVYSSKKENSHTAVSEIKFYWKNKKYDLKVLAFTKLDEFIKTDRYSYTIPGTLHGKWGYHDSSGSFTIAARFDEIKDINNNLIRVKTNNLYGLVDRDGNYFLSPVYNEISTVFELYRIKKENHFGLVDLENNLILPIEYDEIIHTSNGLIVKKNGKSGLTDKNGNIKLPIIYDQISSTNGMGYNIQNNNHIGIFLITQNILLEPLYENIEVLTYSKELEKYFFKFKKNEAFGIIDENKKIITEPKYENIEDLFFSIVLNQNLFKVKINGVYGIIDNNDKIIVEPQWQDITSNYYYDMEIFTITKNNLHGAIDVNGNILVEPKYKYTLGPDINFGQIKYYNDNEDWDSVTIIDKYYSE